MGSTWTYKMRPDMKWSDGEPMTAEDVKYTIDRANEEAWNSHISITANLTAEIVDENTLEITTSVPDPRLPALGVYMIPKHIYEKVSAEDLPNYTAEDKIGGGPFMPRRGRRRSSLAWSGTPTGSGRSRQWTK